MSSTTTSVSQRYHQSHQHQKPRSVITELWFVGLQDPQTPPDLRTWEVSAAQVSGIALWCFQPRHDHHWKEMPDIEALPCPTSDHARTTNHPIGYHGVLTCRAAFA